MKVVLLAPLPPPIGGIASWTKRMKESKLKNGWQVSVVDEKVINGRNVFGNNCQKNIFTEAQRCFLIWRNLYSSLSDKQVRVVHSCIPSAVLSMMREYICALITKFKRKKFIIHYRCTVSNTTRGKIGMFMLKRLCNISDAIIVLNNQSEFFLRDVTKTQIKLIPNFVSCDEICDYRTVSDKIITAIYVGGVIREKGCADIISAAKYFPEINFKLIGSPDEEIIELSKNVNNVTLVGVLEHSEVMCEMKKADIFLFLSRYTGEGFSNALAEAMASGLPCIVSDWAANKDMIENKGGYVVAPGNIKEIRAAFEAMKDKNVRKRQSEFNINKVKTKYSDSTILDMYVDLYEELINKNDNEKFGKII